jgi:glycosyltransferase involved in cell wall biosynthesis
VNILHIIASVNPEHGGPIEGILRQNESSADFGHRREIATLDAPGSPWLAGFPMVVHALADRPYSGPKGWQRYLPWVRYGVSLRFVRWLARHVGEFDVVIVNGVWNFTTLGFVLSGRTRSTPYVVYTHGMLDPWFKRSAPLKHLAKQLFWLFADGIVVNRAAAVFFTAEEERVLADKAFWPYHPNPVVVPYGAGDVPDDTEAQLAALQGVAPLLAGRPYLLFLSRIHPKKGLDLAIEAFARHAARRPDLQFVIAGPDQSGLRPALEARAAALGITTRVHWTGMLSGHAKWGALRNAEALFLPSHQENFGIVVAESLACGVPVLISDKVNIWREIVEDDAGLVGTDSVEGADDVLGRFLDLDPVRTTQMRRNARACFERRFDINISAKQTTARLLKVAGQQPAHGAM